MKQTRNYAFGDQLSEAIRTIKKCEGRKISIIQDELGYALGLNGGSAVERWRQGFLPPKLETRDQLARELIRRSCGTFDRQWLTRFLQEAEHPYAEQLCDELFPAETAVSPPTLSSIPPPPPVVIPTVANFVGRDLALSRLTTDLANGRLALIVGMAGMGKTAIAAQLAQQTTVPTFWHSFHDGEGVETIVWKLAAFLAQQDQPDLWQMLQKSQQTGGKPPPTATLFDYLLQALTVFNPNRDMVAEPAEAFSFHVLLCFDDLQFVDDEPLLTQFLQRLQGIPTVGLIVTSRKQPFFLATPNFQPLAGFDQAETDQFLQQRELALPDSLREELQRLTAGNVQFLTLAIDALKQSHQPAALLQRLAETDDVEQYLLAEIDERLSRDERSVMAACAVLLGQAGTADALAAIVNRDSVQRTVRHLAGRHLLTMQTGEAGRVYQLHAILQAFYYETNGRRQRRRLHERAANFYETEEIDQLKAARHYQAAALYHEAARLATNDVKRFVNQGRATELQHLLAAADAWQLDSLLWVQVLIARGQLETLYGQSQQARRSYEMALRALEPLGKTAVFPNLQAKICLGMGEMLEPTEPTAAIQWLAQGLQASPADPELLAALHLTSGTAHLSLGAFAAAQVALEQGLATLPPQAMQLRSQAWRDIAAAHFHQSNLEQAKEDTYRALEISERLHDWFQMAYLLSNLAVFKFITADWAGAIQDWEQAQKFAQHVGSQEQLTAISVNLGSAYFYQGNNEQAEETLHAALKLAQQHHFELQVVHSQQRLAQLASRRGDWELAEELIAAAWQQAEQLDVQAFLPELGNCWAEIELLSGKTLLTLNRINTALEQAKSLDIPEQVGVSYRLLGGLALTQGNQVEAEGYFQQSLDSLPANLLYEVAQTQLAWGSALLQNGQSQRGHGLLHNSIGVFERLGARYDLEQAKRPLLAL